ncbi:MAG: phosphoadenylyl-sulfate reductase [Candidatus Omnitrophica bacterium]|nr:phosphoadenylyl-sulfate reductase [Candidatus Omnitrophota bacterium]MCM8826977.1 phosphoadenylyl-sulfate reductase [Candidatus Omnitrophota bacterium]
MKNISNFEDKTAEEILRWADETFGNKVAIASSFGLEDVVIIDMMVKINPSVKIFTLDTGRLPQETYDVIERIKERYKVKIDFYFPDREKVEEMVSKYGPNLFYNSVELRRLCCNIRKVEPLSRALEGLSSWICGLRRDQSITRQEIKKIEIDNAHNQIIKINPLADWKEKQVWDYIRENNVPYNTLHDIGYPSIGCEPCTRPIKPGEDIRTGRWWWESAEHKECGLHPSKLRREKC